VTVAIDVRQRYIVGMRPTLAQRVFQKIRITEAGCWEWQGAKMGNGYGKVNINRKTPPVHRVVYEMFNGPVPKHLDMDHLCRNRGCANPEHLEPVTRSENLRRGLGGTRSHCPRGHALVGENVGSRRNCLTCKRARRAEKRGGNVKPYVGDRTHCPQGHAYDEQNTGRINGTRYCRACHRDRAAKKRHTSKHPAFQLR